MSRKDARLEAELKQYKIPTRVRLEAALPGLYLGGSLVALAGLAVYVAHLHY